MLARQLVTGFLAVIIPSTVLLGGVVLGGIDDESDTPGIEALLKDKGVVAEIKGPSRWAS
jgi:hypothetical protein